MSQRNLARFNHNAERSSNRDPKLFEDISLTGVGVVAIHLHRLIINESFYFRTYKVNENPNEKELPIDTFRICISAYGSSRYSKTVRAYAVKTKGQVAEFNQRIHTMIRIYDKRHDKRHLIHVILYGYLDELKQYVLIADRVIDCIQLVSVRHISEAVLFENSDEVCGKASLLIEVVFAYGRHGYNYSSQLIFQNDHQLPTIVQNQTLFERVILTDDKENKSNTLFYDRSNNDIPILLKLSFNELTQYVTRMSVDQSIEQIQNKEVLKALSTSSKYSTLSAIMDMYSSREQRLETLFAFLTEGPFLPEQSIIEPASSRLIPWSIAYWKRALGRVPLHGSELNMSPRQNAQMNITHLQNTSPIIRQIFEQKDSRSKSIVNHYKLDQVKNIVRRVVLVFMNMIPHRKD